MISTVCPYPYGSCKLIRKRQASLHDPDDVMRLIKRCHTVRSQFADELNQDIPFQGWPIGGFQHSWLTFKIKTMLFLHIYIYAAETGTLFSLQLSNQLLCLLSLFSFSPLLLFSGICLSCCSSNPPLVYLGTPVMASKGKVRGELWLHFPALPLTQSD